ncbi:MAG: hypothetical protein HY904_19665 [Deltaproteobacteria bacterium]|nr:hypothetical protein [Deltaproteobacteria bacterium]
MTLAWNTQWTLMCAVTAVCACAPGPEQHDEPPPFPPPRVGGSPETDALADAPARCGQLAHSWLRSAELGTVVARGEVVHHTADFLEGMILAAGVDPPRTPIYDAKVATVTYRTQDRGVLMDATGLLAWPYGLERGRRPDILLLLHGTQGFTDGCSLDQNADTKALAGYFASLGYAVMAPDYLGLKANPPPTGFPHPYLVGQATAIASLDMVRVAAHMGGPEYDDVLPLPRVVLLGGSQGGHAGLWVDRLAPYYAPELELLGGAVTVPPADLVGEVERALREVVDATGNTMAVLGTASSWYGLQSRLGEVFRTPYDVDVPAALVASCDPGDAIPAGAGLTTVFQPLLLDAATAGTVAQVEPWGCLFRENGLTTTSVVRRNPAAASYGLLFIFGEADSLVHTPIERVAYTALCQAGVPAQYLECAGASHTRATLWALPEIADFLDARVAGQALVPACAVSAPVHCQGTPPP